MRRKEHSWLIVVFYLLILILFNYLLSLCVCVCVFVVCLFVLFSFLSVKENDLKKDFDLYQVIFFNEYYCSLCPKHQGNHINSKEICTKNVLKFDVVVILL